MFGRNVRFLSSNISIVATLLRKVSRFLRHDQGVRRENTEVLASHPRIPIATKEDDLRPPGGTPADRAPDDPLGFAI